MRGDKIEFMARREEWDLGISLYLRQKVDSQGLVLAQPLEFKQHNQGSIASPFITIETEEAQQLMDELWQCGLRPSEGTGSAGSLRATEKHLADMRLVVFKKLNIEI